MAYAPMTESGPDTYEGKHANDPVGQLLEATTLVNSVSMDISNDPRFFTDNVLNYRLAAFAGLSVVSGLMIQNAMDHIFDMDKRMNWNSVGGICQTLAFVMLLVVLFLNTIATYVGVAQPYHTVRLMTAGATGFETAASYYLNKSIVVYRHLAIKAMLSSLPLFMMQSGLRLVVKFKRENNHDDLESLNAFQARFMGIASAVVLITMGLFVFYMNYKHQAVFQERYATMTTNPALTAHMATLMNPRAMATMTGDSRGAIFFPDV